MKSVTIEQVIAWQPCGWDGDDDGENYTPQRIEMLFDGRESLTARDIAALDIPFQDIAWLLLRNYFLTDEQMHILACDFAESVVHQCDEPQPQAAIDAKRAWLRGDIGDVELAAARDAARAAARDAARAAARATARAAARATAWDAARGAARAAAWGAAWDAQTTRLLVLLHEAGAPEEILT